jgi:hypothetical protein
VAQNSSTGSLLWAAPGKAGTGAHDHLYRMLAASFGTVTTLAGGSPGSNDGVGTNAQFFSPYGVAVVGGGSVVIVVRTSVARPTGAGSVFPAAPGLRQTLRLVTRPSCMLELQGSAHTCPALVVIPAG